MSESTCAVCGRPSRYLFAFPSGTGSIASTASAGVVYDGAPVCSPACARALYRKRGHKRGRATGGTIGEGAGKTGAQEGE